MSNTNWINRKEYPFESRYFEVPAGRLHYVDEGAGSPIVMVHGNPTWSFLYRDLIKRLKPRYRCIALDHIGFGLSDKPKDWSYLPEDHAKNLSALINGLSLSGMTLILQDWGGPIGLSYAVAHPEKVSRIVLMNTWAWPVNHDFHYVAFSSFMGGPVGQILIRRYNFFAQVLLRQAFGDKGKLGKVAHMHYVRPLQAPSDRKGCMVFPKQIIASTPWLEQIWSGISALNGKPKLFVWGMKDIAFRDKGLRQELRDVEERLKKADAEFETYLEAKEEKPSQEILKKPRRWFKALGQIAHGTAFSIANVALAIGALKLPVSPETQTWGAMASVATGIGTVLSGVGDLRNE